MKSIEAALKKYGVTQSDVRELSDYTKNRFQHKGMVYLDDELFANSWSHYKSDFESLRDEIIEFNFPIKRGMSGDPDYIKAKEEGILSREFFYGRGLDLKAVKIEAVQTPGGKMPVMILENREDFEKVIQCFSYNNEPEKVPKSMGASTYAGYNNWGRINAYKEQWLLLNPESSELDWAKEFHQLQKKDVLYKDSFIVLSNGPYSAVPASAFNLEADAWRRISLEIRKYHETAHYFTKRVLGSMKNNIIDEIFCDYVGLVKATGDYNLKWALTFLGLEDYPSYREGGRLENYSSVAGENAKRVLKELVYDAMVNISKVHRKCDPYLAIYALSKFSLIEIATDYDRVEKHFGEVIA